MRGTGTGRPATHVEAVPEPGLAGGGKANANRVDGLGPGCPFFVQLGSNILVLRETAGLSQAELGERSGVRKVTLSQVETAKNGLLLSSALKLCAALEVSVDRLTEGIYWNRGEVVSRPKLRRPPDKRLRGYFSTLPVGARCAFEDIGEPRVVHQRAEVGAAIGTNMRDARQRRHLRQGDLGLGGKGVVSNIEIGKSEPSLDSLIKAARRLEVPLEFFFRGIRWQAADVAGHNAAGVGYDFRSKDAQVARDWREGYPVREIAGRSGLAELAVEGILRRLRREGRFIPYRDGRAHEDEVPAMTAADVADDFLLRRGSIAVVGRESGIDGLRRRVAANVRDLRGRAGLTFDQLADATEDAAARLWNLENHGFDITVTSLVRLAGGLSTPCSAVVDGVRWDPGRRCFLIDEAVYPAPRPSTAEEVIAANARRIRRASGLAQGAVAARVGLTRKLLADIEAGQRTPRPTRILTVAAALEVEVGELLQGVCDWYVRPLPVAHGSAAAERRRVLADGWARGEDLPAIADALDTTPGSVAGSVNKLRAAGLDLPYRLAPAGPGQLAARLRRGRGADPRPRR